MRCNEKTLLCVESCEKGRESWSEIKHALLRIPAGGSRGRRLRVNPFHQQGNDGSLFLRQQFPALRDTMPPMQAAATTTRASMLCLEHGMPAHGCLVTVPCRMSRCQTLPYKIGRVRTNRIHTHTLNVGGIIRRQPETAAKIGLHQTGQRCQHERKKKPPGRKGTGGSEKDDVTRTISCSRGPGTCRLPS